MAYGRRISIVLYNIDLFNTWSRAVSFMHRPPNPRRNSPWCQSTRRLCGRSERLRQEKVFSSYQK